MSNNYRFYAAKMAELRVYAKPTGHCRGNFTSCSRS